MQQWLKNAEERYSLTSVDRAAVLKARQEEEQRRLSGGTSGADIQITTVKKAGNTLQLDEELVKLEALIVHVSHLLVAFSVSLLSMSLANLFRGPIIILMPLLDAASLSTW